MKTIVRMIAVILAILTLTVSLSACKDKNNGEDDVAKISDYTVTVIDGIGTPVPNVMLKYKDESGETKTRVTGKDGVATLKNALVGESVTVEQGFSTAEILEPSFVLKADETFVRVVVRDTETAREVYGNIDDGEYAYSISTGDYNIPGTKDDMKYFIFGTSTKGIYRVSFTSDDENMTVGCYGDPMIVQTLHILDGAYDGKSFDITVYDIGTPYVIGMNFVSGDDATLKIERIGDAPVAPEYEPWTIIPARESFKEFSTGNLTDLNIADPSLSVTLKDDGYYYTSSGKLVYVRIGSNSQYLDVSIAFIAGFVDENIGQNFGGYVYDENGNFVDKYSYNDMIGAYYEHCDSNGVYPLTAELAEAIKCHGESAGWWNSESPNFLFEGKMFEEKNAWLFLCCVEQ